MAFAGSAPSTPGEAERSLTLLPLPLAGLLSDEPSEQVGATFARMEQELRAAGVGVKAPILLLTLLSLSVSPDFKVTDLGIADVQARRILAPEVEA
jgi:adenine deaminase